ncbi:Cytochrome c2 [Oryzisolibacter propanilivorax]|uniref:Cytochrome c2 n=1 Tax=Oryzisolibacter propanilivorax TaxID=1527607 RepID=A0A1G9P6M2_9BURK|nr:c-type cytochrome [Oryzisolibacter propanilivorax]SDL94458.1 Cytochrome c2 [Oryzisolibacter propanilivorax]
MRRVRLFLVVAATGGVLLLAALGSAALLLYTGVYDVSATRQHWQPVYSTLAYAMQRSVKHRARDIEEPPLADPLRLLRGAACFQAKCVQCHGAPGVSQGDVGKSLQPLPGPLVDARQHWRPRELYWLVRNGLKMTGMPAWQYRLKDDEIWDVVAFMQHLPELNASQYGQWQRDARAMRGSATCGRSSATPAPGQAPDARRGRQALHQHACTSCHQIPGVTGAPALVGPPLDALGRRVLIAGTLDNTPQNLVRWIMHTQQVKPGTAMPELDVPLQDARDMAAYLSTLH